VNFVSVVPSRQGLVVTTVPKTAQNFASSPDSHAASSSAISKGKCFPRESRLLRHADFDRVYREGKRHFSTNMTVFFLPRPESVTEAKPPMPASGLRIGLTVSRALGGAVDRNRLRRRMREAVRMTRPLTAPAIDVVINPKRLVLKTEFEVLVKEVDRAFETVLRKSAGGEK
jgi:ribonuclease P protein component